MQKWHKALEGWKGLKVQSDWEENIDLNVASDKPFERKMKDIT
jgi:hypothetical protein